MPLFKIVYCPEGDFLEIRKGLKYTAYYDPDERTVFVSGYKINPVTYLHEMVHAVRDRILPECIGKYLDILFDLSDTFVTKNSYKRGLWRDLKSTWREYRC